MPARDDRIDRLEERMRRLEKKMDWMVSNLAAREEQPLVEQPVAGWDAVAPPVPARDPAPAPPSTTSFRARPSPPRPGPPSLTNVERNLGENWLAKAGMVVFVLGVVFFLRYAYEREWIGPLGRILLGVVGGLVIAAIGDILMLTKRYGRVYPQVLSGGGLVITYFSVYASYGLLSYREALGVSLETAAIGMAVVATVTALYAGLRETPVLTGLGAALGVLTVVFSSTWTAFAVPYVVILTLALLVSALWREWEAVAAGALAAAQVSFFWLLAFGDAATAAVLLGVWTVTVVGAALGLVRSWKIASAVALGAGTVVQAAAMMTKLPLSFALIGPLLFLLAFLAVARIREWRTLALGAIGAASLLFFLMVEWVDAPLEASYGMGGALVLAATAALERRWAWVTAIGAAGLWLVTAWGSDGLEPWHFAVASALGIGGAALVAARMDGRSEVATVSGFALLVFGPALFQSFDLRWMLGGAAVATALVLAIGVWRRWDVVLGVGFVVAAVLGLLARLVDVTPRATLGYASALLVAFLGSVLALRAVPRTSPSRHATPGETALLQGLSVASLILPWLVAQGALDVPAWDDYYGPATAGMALLGIGLALLRAAHRDARIGWAVAGVFFAIIWPAIQFDGYGRTIAWSGLLLATAIAAMKSASILMRVVHYVLSGIVLLAIAFETVALADAAEGWREIGPLAAFVVATAAMGVGAWSMREHKDKTDGTIGRAFLAATVAIPVLWFATAIDGAGITIAWATEALILAAVGFGWKLGDVRIASLALVVLVLARIFLIDMAALDEVWRIITFLVVGAIVVGLSFLYARTRGTTGGETG